jgi:plastocyanin
VHRTRYRSIAPLLLAVMSIGTYAADSGGVSGRVVGKDGKGIAHAVVFVQTSNAADAAPAGSAPRATLDQINKTFVPGVLPVVVGTEVRFPNHDQIHHHVYSFSRIKSFELPLYKGQDARPVLFDKPGVVKVGCNIHDWMSAVILVLPTTHYAQTDDEGRFTLSGLPAGNYTLAAWHELSRDKVEDTLQQVQVPSGTADVDFTLALALAKARPAMHGLRRDQ